jgi:sugar phosphate isomerase/epimerase
MKIACQEGLVPGETFKEKVDNMVELGFEGVELGAPFSAGGAEVLRRRADEIMRTLEDAPLAVSSICGGQPMTFLAGDLAQRKAAVDGYKETLKVAGQLKCIGPILVPIFGPPQLTDPWPLKTVEQLELQILVAICKELAAVASANKTNVVLEPLNRYETHLLNRLADATQVCRRAGSPRSLKVMADFFHMNIEEADIAASIRKAGKAICHVHLADSRRMQPGSGHMDFAAGFKALKEIKFKGYMAFECGVSGKDPMASLRKSVEYLRELRASL